MCFCSIQMPEPSEGPSNTVVTHPTSYPAAAQMTLAFFDAFPEYHEREVYFTGESCAARPFGTIRAPFQDRVGPKEWIRCTAFTSHSHLIQP